MDGQLRYSEAFKMHVVQELASGKLSCINEACKKYGKVGFHTIRGWLNKYGRKELIPRVVRVEMPEEKSEIKKLKKRIRELEKALADTKIDSILDRAHFEVLCEQMGIKDIAGMKKKIAEQLSKEDES